jgi:hypothetical protein
MALALLAAAGSAAADSVPAGFGSGEKSLGELIEFPELKGDTIATISCIGIVEKSGKLDRHGCYKVNPGDDTFIASIYKAVKKARLTPASIDGKEVDVVFQYRAQFVKKGDTQTVEFVANPGHGENVEAYGSEHVAAQRVMAKETWEKSCPQQARFIVLARANVDYEGRPGAVSIEHLNGIQVRPKCIEALTANILASRFIPAFADGEPVPSAFLEPFGN